MNWEGTGGSREGGETKSLPKPFFEQHADNRVESSKKNAEPKKCRQGGRMTHLHGLYYRHVFRGGKVDDCAVLMEVNLTAQEVLGRWDLDSKLYDLDGKSRGIERSSGERMGG